MTCTCYVRVLSSIIQKTSGVAYGPSKEKQNGEVVRYPTENGSPHSERPRGSSSSISSFLSLSVNPFLCDDRVVFSLFFKSIVLCAFVELHETRDGRE